jgi:hypothetical protein
MVDPGGRVLIAMLTAALAASPGPEPPARVTWEAMDRRSVVLFDAAATASALGLATTFLGIATEKPAIAVAGMVIEAPSAPLMAASSLRSARSIRARGGRASSAGGYTSWALWAGGIGLFVRAEVVAREPTPDLNVVTLTRFAGGGLHLAAFAAAGMQGFSNTRGRYGLVAPAPVARMRVVPTTRPPGLALHWTGR